MGEPDKRLESLWTKVGDLAIHSKVAFHEGNATLPPIILVHGLGVSSRYMMPLARLLAAERSVYAIDLPGFGRSEKPRRALNLTEQANALIAWMGETKIACAVLLANSIGCQIVIDIALARPDLVERIILVSPMGDAQAQTVFKQYLRLLLDIPREPLSLSLIALKDYLWAGLGRVAATFASALEDKVEEKLPGVRHPTLVVRGERRFHHRAIAGRLHHVRAQVQRHSHRRGAFERHVKVGGHGAWWRRLAVLVHQVHRRCPVAVAVEERADDPAVEHPGVGLVVRLRLPSGHQAIPHLVALDPQPLVVGGAAAEAAILRRVTILDARAGTVFDRPPHTIPPP